MFNYSNKIFAVNGEKHDLSSLSAAIRLIMNNGGRLHAPVAYDATDKGLVFYLYKAPSKASKSILGGMSDSLVSRLAEDYLKGVWAGKLAWPKTLKEYEQDVDIDGTTEEGWLVYTDENGKIDDYSAFAVKPVYIWYHK